jgi:CheY-like chemotaxis protein
VKFTDKGSIEVRVRYDAARARLAFAVEDSGIGLSAGEAGRLFQPFMQADSSTTRRFGGTGLGLVISKQLAQLLGGDVILADSKAGRGSTFVVTVATGEDASGTAVGSSDVLDAMSRPSAARRPSAVRLDGIRALVADDTPDNRLLLRRILGYAGATVETVDNGAEAIATAASTLFDVVLMDIQMPQMDGLEATRRLREIGYRGPVIALTAHAMKEDLQRCLAAGCNLHIAKPIDAARLLLAVKNLAGTEPTGGVTLAAPPTSR